MIAIVENNRAVRDSLGMLLAEFNPIRCATAEELLEHSCCQDIEGLIVDLHLEQMNGSELIDALDERGIQVPTVLITGDGQAAIPERLQLRRDLHLVRKPFRAQSIIEFFRAKFG